MFRLSRCNGLFKICVYIIVSQASGEGEQLRANLIFEMTKRDFTERYAGSFLGAIWNFIMPAVMIFIYTVIFSQVMKAKMPGVNSAYSFGIYLIAGILPWLAFSNTILRSSSVFIDKKNLISKMPISLASFPLYVALSECVTFAIGFSIYLVFMLSIGISIPRFALLMPFILAVQQIFAYAFGLLLATFSVFFRDLKEVVNVAVQLWFWFTPIVYMSSILPESVQHLLNWNPAWLFINSYQQIFFYGVTPNIGHLVILTLLGHTLLFLAFIVLRKLEKDVRDFL